MHRRLDGRIAEAFPRRGERDHVAGPIGIVDGDAAFALGRAEDHRALRPLHQGIELRAESVFGRTEEPVRRPQLGGQPDAAGHVLARNGPGRLQHEPPVAADPEGGAHPIVLATARGSTVSAGVDTEGVVDGGGVDAPVGQLKPAELIDGDLAPSTVDGRGWFPLELGPLPRKVVVVKDGRPTGEHLSSDSGGARVEGQGAHVLHHHQVGVVEGCSQLRPGRRLRRPDGESGKHEVDEPSAGNGARGESEHGQRSLPLGCLDGHAVGASESKREQGCGGNGATVVGSAPPATWRRSAPRGAARTIRSGQRPRQRSTVIPCLTTPSLTRRRPHRPLQRRTSWPNGGAPS